MDAKIKQFILKPANQFAFALGFYAIFATILNFDQYEFSLFFSFSILLGIAVIGYYVVNLFRKRSLQFVNYLISVIIFYLILDPNSHWIELLVIGLLFVSLKFVRYKNMPIINPVVFTLLTSYVLSLISPLSSPFVSWWGAAFMDYWSILLLIPALYISCIKFPKYMYFLTFIGSFILLEFLVNGVNLYYVLTGTLYFAIGVMALEVKTSPLKKLDQLVLGVIGGLVLFLTINFHFEYPYLFAILISNILFFIKKLIWK